MNQESLNTLLQLMEVSKALETLNKGIVEWKTKHNRDPDLICLNENWFQEIAKFCSLFEPLNSDDVRYQDCYLYKDIKIRPICFVEQGSFYFLDSPEFSSPFDPFPFIPYPTFHNNKYISNYGNLI